MASSTPATPDSALALKETTRPFDDGRALFQAVCEHGLEGTVAKRSASAYRPGQRGWIKIKNPGYWRRDQEIQALRRSLERRAAA